MIDNDFTPVSSVWLVRTAVISVVILLCTYFLWVIARRQFVFDSNQNDCKKDPDYCYKDPAQHPYDCK